MLTFDSYAIIVDHVMEEDFILNLTAFCGTIAHMRDGHELIWQWSLMS